MRDLTPAQVWQGRTYALLGTFAGGFLALDRYLGLGHLMPLGLIPLFGSSFAWMWFRGGPRYAARTYLRAVIGTMILFDIFEFFSRERRRW
jgi:hypothetical protein